MNFMTFKVQENKEGFLIEYNDRKLITHTFSKPAFYVGYGEAEIEMYRGNFKIQDYKISRVPLKYFKIKEESEKVYIDLYSNDGYSLSLCVKEMEDRLYIDFEESTGSINRYWIRIDADEDEKVYGCGEQMSYFNLRGRNFPLWTSEPGVGRDKSTYITWMADVMGKAGGDYYNTNYPQPTFVSTRKYYCHLESSAYMDFNFKNKYYHELEVWDIPKYIMFETAETFIELVSKISSFFGRQPLLPEWVYSGLILGVQGGTDRVLEKMNKAIEKGVKLSGLWCQDWQGRKITSFGKRLFWNWKWNPQMYPELDKKIWELKDKGIRFLGYINPYLIKEGDLYKEAYEKGYLATKLNGDDYLVDFGEFYCGIVDFTNPEAFEWYKGVIKKNLIEFGLDGWMADFGEYLPTDCKLYNGVSAEIMHNAWPTIWARCNYEALKETGKLGEILFFMRAGFTGVQRYCTLLWAGDQSVDFSIHDGLASVIPGALSSGMMGNGLHHSDIGGYTSLFGLKRTKELFLRWAEMAAFTPVMRTHEGNRPDENFQVYDDDGALEHLALMTSVYVKLSPYLKDLVKQNTEEGIPVQRPLFMHYEDDKNTYDIQYQYMYGRDILVAPVYKEGMNRWSVYLPQDEWIHMPTGQEFRGGYVEVDVPFGKPAVFYRKSSKYRDLFEDVTKLFKEKVKDDYGV